MGKEIVTTKWHSNMAFESEVNGHKIVIDAESDFNAKSKAPVIPLVVKDRVLKH